MNKLAALFLTFVLVLVIVSVIAGFVFGPLAGMITACGIILAFNVGVLILKK